MKIHENPTSMIQRINPSQCKFGRPEVVIIWFMIRPTVLYLHYFLADADLQGRTRLISNHTF